MRHETLRLGKDGAQLFSAAISTIELRDLEITLATQPRDHAGVRLRNIPQLQPFLAPSGPIGRMAVSVLGEECLPVRAVLFDKSAGTNWSLGWHQDRTIAVQQRIDVNGFGPWSLKRKMVHVEPPFELLAGMLTLRVHFDPVPESNAPLLIAPGSHHCGRIPWSVIPEVVEQCGVVSCLADAGDVWLYSTPILHASDAALKPRNRRVLQIDYSAGELPGGLRWLGV